MKIALVTGDRADWSAIDMLAEALGGDDRFEAEVLDAQRVRLVPLMPKPDMVVLHGDRHEILEAAVKFNIAGCPIAHLSGGDITEGSQDDCYRHAVTKLSHLHFPSNVKSGRRLIQMGEQPDRVHVVGCPSVDRIARTYHLSREEAFAAVGLQGCERCLLAAIHPETLSDTGQLVSAVLGALRGVAGHIGVVLTGPNPDRGRDLVAQALRLFAAERPNTVYRDHYDNRLWLSLMAHCDLLVGNSSCAFYEAPSLALPCINVGDRQKGRIRTALVWDVPTEVPAILSGAIAACLDGLWRPRLPAVNPYGDGHACERIVSVLASIDDPKRLLRKVFHERRHGEAEVDLGGSASDSPLGNVSRAGDGAVRAAEAEAGGARP
jgi:UDP-hydrolysing UDP-N-acetyl-D-glucosamine 2-epimerase